VSLVLEGSVVGLRLVMLAVCSSLDRSRVPTSEDRGGICVLQGVVVRSGVGCTALGSADFCLLLLRPLCCLEKR